MVAGAMQVRGAWRGVKDASNDVEQASMEADLELVSKTRSFFKALVDADIGVGPVQFWANVVGQMDEAMPVLTSKVGKRRLGPFLEK